MSDSDEEYEKRFVNWIMIAAEKLDAFEEKGYYEELYKTIRELIINESISEINRLLQDPLWKDDDLSYLIENAVEGISGEFPDAFYDRYWRINGPNEYTPLKKYYDALVVDGSLVSEFRKGKEKDPDRLQTLLNNFIPQPQNTLTKELEKEVYDKIMEKYEKRLAVMKGYLKKSTKPALDVEIIRKIFGAKKYPKKTKTRKKSKSKLKSKSKSKLKSKANKSKKKMKKNKKKGLKYQKKS